MHKTNQKQLIYFNLNPTFRPFEVIIEFSNKASDPRPLPSPHIYAQKKSKPTNEVKYGPNIMGLILDSQTRPPIRSLFPVLIYMHKTNKKQPIHLNLKPTLRPSKVIMELSERGLGSEASSQFSYTCTKQIKTN
jgi:hypothetical protein